MQDEPQKDESPSKPVPVTKPEQQGGDAAALPDNEAAETVPNPEETPAKPVDDPDLPEDGDPEDFDEEEVSEDQFDADPDETMDVNEEPEEPLTKEQLPEGAHRSDYDD